MACLLELLYATGLRVSELVALPRTAASIDARLLVVKGKGGRERMVPLTETARAAMAAHLPAVPEDSPWLFPADSESGHLTRQAFARDLKDAASAAGLRADKVSPHVLPPSSRVTCSTTGRTCVSCRNCWATRTFRLRKSTRTFWTTA